MNTPSRSPALLEGRVVRSPAVRRTLLVILTLKIAAVVVKLLVGVRTRSLAVLGAALESTLDTLNNVIGMVLVGVAARAPDDDHPYGHDKFETLGALGVAWSGYRILKQIVPVLVDQRGVDAAELRRLLGEIQEISDVRTVRSRVSPSGVLFAELTIGVPAGTSVADVHLLADAIEALIAERLGASEVTVHVEPV